MFGNTDRKLTLALEKPGSAPAPKLQLSLTKGGVFTAEVWWDCDPAHADDVDVHGLGCADNGEGAKVTSLDRVLSTYNTKKMNPRGGVLQNNPDGSFSALGGALTHSGDKRVQKNTERITIDTSLLPSDVNEIPLIATVHRADHGEEHEADHDSDEESAFADIEVVEVTIRNEGGQVLATYVLSDEFGEFDVVQLGSIMLSDDGIAEYAPVGRGFNGDFNDVLGFFS